MKPGQITLLRKSDYRKLYDTSFVKPADVTVKALEREWEELRDKLRTTLGVRWEESCFGDADFAISDDWSEAFHHCGSINSERILCPFYADTIASALATMRHHARWTFHTVIELNGEVLPSGEFFIRGGMLYAPKGTKFDYQQAFAQR